MRIQRKSLIQLLTQMHLINKIIYSKENLSRRFFFYPNEVRLLAIRLDKQGGHRGAYEKNKKIIFKTQNTCGICGRAVDFSIKTPDPLSAVIDHIIPVSKGGHPSDIENLQLAHWTCNRQKSDKLFISPQEEPKVLGNRNLPQTINWVEYKG